MLRDLRGSMQFARTVNGAGGKSAAAEWTPDRPGPERSRRDSNFRVDETLQRCFNLESIISAAGELRYIGAIKRVIASEFKQPEDDWIKFPTTSVYGPLHSEGQEQDEFQFAGLVTKARPSSSSMIR